MLQRSSIFPRPSRAARSRGFTLIEAALTTMIVGVGVVAMMQLLAAGTMANADSTGLTTAVTLANNVRELTQTLCFVEPGSPTSWGRGSGETLASYDDLDDFDNLSFSPPIDARRQTITELQGWQQSIDVESVDPDFVRSDMGHGSLAAKDRPLSRISVTINRRGKLIYRASWLVSYDPSKG